jgi:hypothetical protein
MGQIPRDIDKYLLGDACSEIERDLGSAEKRISGNASLNGAKSG